MGCISLYSYIKPQLLVGEIGIPRAVYPYIPTSNRNRQYLMESTRVLYILIFLHQTATFQSSKNNTNRLYILIFLHQTATLFSDKDSWSLLYILIFLHQTATCVLNGRLIPCCISLYSYIKPQRVIDGISDLLAVYPYIPTSNRNGVAVPVADVCAVYPYIPTSNRNNALYRVFIAELYILIFLHQTATIEDGV